MPHATLKRSKKKIKTIHLRNATITRCAEGKVNKQSHACALYLLGNPKLYKALMAAGHYKEAVIMKAMASAWLAFKMAGLTAQKRFEMLHVSKRAVVAIMGKRLYNPAALKKQRTNGVLGKQLLDLLLNAEQCLNLAQQLTTDEQRLLLNRHLTTMLLETEFSCTFSITGGQKPTVEQLKNSTMFRDVVLMIKGDTERNFVTTTSKRDHKDPTDEARLDRWNDGTGDIDRYFFHGTDCLEKRAARRQLVGHQETKIVDLHKVHR